jgi:hypothetical protein
MSEPEESDTHAGSLTVPVELVTEGRTVLARCLDTIDAVVNLLEADKAFTARAQALRPNDDTMSIREQDTLTEQWDRAVGIEDVHNALHQLAAHIDERTEYVEHEPMSPDSLRSIYAIPREMLDERERWIERAESILAVVTVAAERATELLEQQP